MFLKKQQLLATSPAAVCAAITRRPAGIGAGAASTPSRFAATAKTARFAGIARALARIAKTLTVAARRPAARFDLGFHAFNRVACNLLTGVALYLFQLMTFIRRRE